MDEEQTAIAYLLGRLVAAEKALQFLIARASLPADAHTLMRLNLQIREQHLPDDIAANGLPESASATAGAAYAAASKAVLRGLQSGKYVSPDVRAPCA